MLMMMITMMMKMVILMMFLMMQSVNIKSNTLIYSTGATTSFQTTQRQLTIMLVTICCAAVCLQLPYTIIYLINDEKKSLWPGQYDDMVVRAKIYLCMKVAEMFATSNYAVNFALYCVSGSAFRQSVRRFCRTKQRLQRQGDRYNGGQPTR